MPTFRYTHAATNAPAYPNLPIADFLWRVLLHVLPRGLFLHGRAKRRLTIVQLILRVMIATHTHTPRPTLCCRRCQTPMRVVHFPTRPRPDG